MKTGVAVTLIIVGGFLILGPVLSDYVARAQVATMMSEQRLNQVMLNPPPMSSTYRFGCWFVGTMMIAAAIVSARRKDG